MIVSLVGYMGSGKSTTGKDLAKALGYQFIDLDEYIEEKYQAKIGRGVMFDNALTSAYGVDNIKDIASKSKGSKQSYKNLTVKAGGGAFTKKLSLFDESGKINPLLLFDYMPDHILTMKQKSCAP